MSAAAAAARATGNPGINNTAWLFFILGAAFLFYVTVRGDLPKWLGLFGLAPGSAAGRPAAAPAGSFQTLPNVLGGASPAMPSLPNLTGGSVDTGTWDFPQPPGGSNPTQSSTW